MKRRQVKEVFAMKAYTPQDLAAVSRCQNYIPMLSTDVRQEVYARICAF